MSKVSLQALSFSAGLRTRDNGELGDTSAETLVDPQLGPVAGNTEWQLLRGDEVLSGTRRRRADPVRIIATRGGRYRLKAIDAANGDALGECQVAIPQFARITAPIWALEPSLTAIGVNDDRHEEVLNALLGVAKPVCQHILRPANIRIVWPGDPLPPPFRLHSVPNEADAPLTPEQPIMLGDQQFHCFPTNVVLASPASMLCSAADFAAALNRLADTLEEPVHAATAPFRTLFPHLLSEPDEEAAGARQESEPGWGFDGRFSSLDVGMVRIGLGAFDFDGNALDASTRNPVDEVLHSLAFEAFQGTSTAVPAPPSAPVDWADPTSQGYVDFIEAAGRQIGVLSARAVLRTMGMPIETGHVADDAGNVALSSLMAPAPHDPLLDTLGLNRPAARPAAMLSVDLHRQRERRDSTTATTRAARSPLPTDWSDIVAFEAARIREERAMPGAMSPYDALCGLVSEESLDWLETDLGKLPATYGPHTFAPGDRDVAVGTEQVPVYGGETQPNSRLGDDMVSLLQADLEAIGNGLGLEAPRTYNGFYGYRRFEAGIAKYDGSLRERPAGLNDALRIERKLGTTEWAVREFQIALRYPNRVAERIDGTEHYAQRLRTVATGLATDINDRSDDVAGIAPPDANGNTPTPVAEMPSAKVDGAFDVLDAAALQRWRFRRMRMPVLLVAGSTAGEFVGPNPTDTARGLSETLEMVESVVRTDQLVQTGLHDAAFDRLASRSFRVRAFDRSGYFGAPTGSTMLGRYGTYNHWGGPQATADHAQADVSLANTLGAIAPNPNDQFLSAFRVVAAVAEVEAVGHYDGFNAYDMPIFSYPLFHLTLTLSESSPGLMAGFVRWLQDPPGTLLNAVFPAPAAGSNPNHPNPYPDANGVDALRIQLSRTLRETYHAAFGHFGVGAGRTNRTPEEGFITLSNRMVGTTPAGTAVDMGTTWTGTRTNPNAQQALYQSYQEWFRNWQWFYRFAAPLRHNQTLRTALFAYILQWTHEVMNGVANDIRTERGRAAWLRLKVLGNTNFTANDAVALITNARRTNPNVDEATTIMNEAVRLAVATDTLRAAIHYNWTEWRAGRTANPAPLDPAVGILDDTARQNISVYLNVRNDLLRRLVV